MVIECSGLSVVKGGTAILRDLDWQVRAQDRWVIIGPNGAGKSTLLDIVSARAHPTTGQVRLLGSTLGRVDVFELRPRIGVVVDSVSSTIPRREIVLRAVLTAAYGMTGTWRETYDPVDEARARELLDRFGVGALADRGFATLSDGERKRVLLARALMPDPEILVLDEPAAGLDLGAREVLVSLLSDLARDPAAPAIVLVTHHVEEVPPDFTHGLLLSGGAAVASGPLSEVIRGGPLGRAFGTPITVGRFAQRYFAMAAPGG